MAARDFHKELREAEGAIKELEALKEFPGWKRYLASLELDVKLILNATNPREPHMAAASVAEMQTILRDMAKVDLLISQAKRRLDELHREMASSEASDQEPRKVRGDL
jgi:hypothetical protein